MGIIEQIDTIFIHPAFRLALNKAKLGDESELRFIFFETMFHTYEKSTLNASRNYGKSRWLNTCHILEEIRNTAPPENLDIRFKIPPKTLTQNVEYLVKEIQMNTNSLLTA